MELGILLRRHFLHAQERIEDAKDEDGGPAVERIDDAVGNDAFRRFIGDADPGEEDREQVAHQGARVAQETLDGIGSGLLLLVHHVADHHLEGLHRDVDGGVQEDQGEQAEPHRHVQAQEQPGGEVQRARIREEQHHQDGHDGAHDEVGLAAAHPGPGPVGPLADEGLDDHAHQRREDPEPGELVRIRAEGGEDAADIGALQGVRDLDPEKAEAQVHHLPESQVAFRTHSVTISAVWCMQK